MHALTALIALASAFAEASEPGIEGYWRNPKGTVIISIEPCGQTVCGTVKWASDGAKADARRGGTDPLIGANLLTNVVAKGDGKWTAKLLVPDLNKRSSAAIQLLAPDKLKVSGCTVGRLFCRSQLWTRTTVAELEGDQL